MKKAPVYFGFVWLLSFAACDNAWYLPKNFTTLELTYAESGDTEDTILGTLTFDRTSLQITGSSDNATHTFPCAGTATLTETQVKELAQLVGEVTLEENGVYEITGLPTHTLKVDAVSYEVLPGKPGTFFIYRGRCALLQRLNELFPVADRTSCPASLDRMFACGN